MAWYKKQGPAAEEAGKAEAGDAAPAAAAAPADTAASTLEQVGRLVEEQVSQSALMRHQVGQLAVTLGELRGQAAGLEAQTRTGIESLLKEFQRFHTGGPQRAMAGVFAKLFRDLLRHLNELDGLVALASAGGPSGDGAWRDALRVECDHFEAILRDWGLRQIEVRIGSDEFDPEIHEADLSSPPDGDAGSSQRIVAVTRRGWVLGDTVLQSPVVVTG